MNINYPSDYVDYMKELYPEITEKGISEMIEDCLEMSRRYLREPRHLKVGKIKSTLFDGEQGGRFKFSTIYSANQWHNVRRKLESKTRKREESNNNE